jgi:urea transport system substrate-binding protein
VKRTKTSLTRRDLLKRAGKTGLTLAAAQALSPFILSGCGSSTGGNTTKVGIMHSLSGFMKISESSLKDAEMMAIEEINEKGGVLGKKIEPIVEDPASDFEKGFPEKARKLLQSDKVACVFGCWTSASRKSVLSIFEKNNGLLLYPVQYEGNECSKNVIYTGAAPNQQILPAVDYIVEKMGKKKWYLLGSDYVFPQTANQIIIAQLKSKYKIDPINDIDARTGQRAKYVPLTHKDFKNVIDDIKAKQPDMIFSTINGDSNLPFYNELAGNNITAESMPVCAVSVGEDELRGLDPPIVKGHLAAWNYFQTVKTPENVEFVKKFKSKYGPDRVTDDPIEAAYYQVYFWKQGVEKAGTATDIDKVIQGIRGQTFKAPEGMVKVDEKNNHTWKPFRLGKIRDDRQFDIVYETPEWIRPEPYPQVAYPGQDCDWTKGGEIKSKA